MNSFLIILNRVYQYNQIQLHRCVVCQNPLRNDEITSNKNKLEMVELWNLVGLFFRQNGRAKTILELISCMVPEKYYPENLSFENRQFLCKYLQIQVFSNNSGSSQNFGTRLVANESLQYFLSGENLIFVIHCLKCSLQAKMHFEIS